ncbi:MAG: alkene reductase, partial [Nannocystaceae bacterium]|nr:alkene reductase [Nannocystaceae bacterium]
MPTLFDPLTIGSIELQNRVVMAPLTRGRAQPDGTPTALLRTYYRQRASAGLIVTEATAISSQGTGWFRAPGIYTDDHERGWKPVTDAVHERGGKIVLQLWHMGRASHRDFHNGELQVGPSAIAVSGTINTPNGPKDYEAPRALETSELPGITEDYVAAARRAIAAGFDGVEVHAANGYLLDQFIRDGSNKRTDDYGGSLENRWRFPLQVVEAVAGAIGAGRTGVRLSPTNAFQDMSDSDPVATFVHGTKALAALNPAFIHLIDPPPGHMFGSDTPLYPHMRPLFEGALILNGGFDRA